VLRGVDVARSQIGDEQSVAAKYIQRQKAVTVVITREETPLLLAVHRRIGRVKISISIGGALACDTMNCSTNSAFTAHAAAQACRFSKRHNVGALAISTLA
jgi:hypothetical protein